MDISASMEEIRVHKPDVSRGALIRPGLSVGQSVLGTMTTTLMLAYSGSYLSMLMYFVGQNTLVTFTESVWSVGSVGRTHCGFYIHKTKPQPVKIKAGWPRWSRHFPESTVKVAWLSW